jgi:hypothetical protein
VGEGDENSEVRSRAKSLTTFYETYNTTMEFLLGVFFSGYSNCTLIQEKLLSDDVHGEICSAFENKTTNLAIVFLALSCLCVVGVGLLQLGAKRWQHMSKAGSAEPLTVTSPSQFAANVLIQTEEDRRDFGSPLLGPSPPPPASPPGITYPSSSSLQEVSEPRYPPSTYNTL